MSKNAQVQTWQHRTRGEIRGTLISADPEWARIDISDPQSGVKTITVQRHSLDPVPEIMRRPEATVWPSYPQQIEDENAKLRHRLATIEHGWSSPLGSPTRWATEPIPFPRNRNDVYRIQSDYMRSIECSMAGPTPEERQEKSDQLCRDAMDLTYEVMHLRMTAASARKEITRLNAETSRLAGVNGGLEAHEHLDAARSEAARRVTSRMLATLWRSRRRYQAALDPYIAEDVRRQQWESFGELSDLRCLDCSVRFAERQDYGCPHYSGKHTEEFPCYGAGHSYEKAEVDRLAKAAGHGDVH
ncbi:MAG: hypothetical protein WBF79_13505 [Rhodococcus sp. (in: high G+C Gram-positive bacteria)]